MLTDQLLDYHMADLHQFVFTYAKSRFSHDIAHTQAGNNKGAIQYRRKEEGTGSPHTHTHGCYSVSAHLPD